jgi:hypothetical protein
MTVRNYRAQIDFAMERLLAGAHGADALLMIELGLQHEQQHQELIVTDVKHLLACHPGKPAYLRLAVDTGRSSPAWLGLASPVEW